jgi:Protein of unknown function (DUF1320)
MAYLGQDDYSLSISVTNLNEILTVASGGSSLSTTQVRQNAEAMATAEINAYLSPVYNIAGELGKTSSDTSRSFLIINIMVNIALWYIHHTINPRDIPEVRQTLYDKAMSDLADFRDGKLVLSIPRLSASASGGRRRIEIYSNQKFTSKQFDDPSFLNPEQSLTP